VPPRPKRPRPYLVRRPGRPAVYVTLHRGKQIWTGIGEGGPDAASKERQYKLAEHASHKYEATLFEPQATKQDNALVLVEAAIAQYASDKAPGHATPKATGQRLSKVSAFFKGKRLSQVNEALCRSYWAQRGSTGAGARELEDLRAACNYYYYKLKLCREPVDVWVPEPAGRRERYLTEAEVWRLMLAAHRRNLRHVIAFIWIAIWTGARMGRICDAALQPTPGHGHFDLENGLFLPRPGRRETKKSQPKIRIPEKLLKHLRRWKRRGQRFAVEHNHQRVVKMDHGFRDCRRDAGLGDDVIPHTLKHTAITWLLGKGVSIWDVAGYVGTSPQIIEKHYGHHNPEANAEVLAAIDGAPTIANGTGGQRRNRGAQNAFKSP
jgi:integrase